MLIQDIEFDVKPINRKQRRVLLRDYKFDVVKFAMDTMREIAKSNPDDKNFVGLNIDTAQLDAVLDVCFSNRDADLDKIGLTGQIQLFTAIISLTTNLQVVTEEEIKN